MAVPDQNPTAQASGTGLAGFWDLLREIFAFSTLVPPTLLSILSYHVAIWTRRQKKFSPDTDIADLSGKIILVTGANTGIGKETALRLAEHGPVKIYLAARNEAKAQDAIADVKKSVPQADIHFLQMDLMSFDSIKKAARKVGEECSRLDILVLNAGIMATPWSTTHEGFEAQFGTNYVGHALLTRLLLPIMTKTSELPNADVRIISVSSVGHNMAPRGGILFDEEALKALTPLQLYGQSKLANILLVKALAKRYPKIMSVAVHPGMIRTEIYSPIMKARWLINSALKIVGPLVFADVRFGALTQLWAATAPRKNVTNGTYYMPVGKDMGASKYSKDAELSEKLWKWTEEQFKQHGIPQT